VTLGNLLSVWRAPPPGLDKAQLRGWENGMSFRRFARGWQLWTTRSKAGCTAGTGLDTAEHGDRRLPPPPRSDTQSRWTLRVERRHQSPRTVPPVALPVKPPGWEANDSLQADFEDCDGDLTSLVGETAASEASTRLDIRRLLQRQQPPARQFRLPMPHSRRHMLLRPAKVTSRAPPLCRMRMTAAFYCNRWPKRLLLERGCTDGTGPRPSLEP